MKGENLHNSVASYDTIRIYLRCMTVAEYHPHNFARVAPAEELRWRPASPQPEARSD